MYIEVFMLTRFSTVLLVEERDEDSGGDATSEGKIPGIARGNASAPGKSVDVRRDAGDSRGRSKRPHDYSTAGSQAAARRDKGCSRRRKHTRAPR